MPTRSDIEQIEELLDQVMAGGIGLHQVAPCLRAWYFAGYNEALAKLAPQLHAAEYDRDRYYEQLHNPGKQFSEMVQRRIDQAAIQHQDEPSPIKFYSAVIDAATSPRRAA
ncbi:hypothetical protein [Gulosibacter bifidus]|uniref:Uncharacterized protein n=1 Tax=Gulosibacter bifidus TaxID=272239 RepID=A0ABW5RIY0_9MICO|nr:hypothetical protein [Gulosibacter bifidus]